MNCKLVFEDWRQMGKLESIYGTEEGLGLSSGDLHSGSTFKALVVFDKETEQEIEKAMQDYKAYPVFRLITDEQTPEEQKEAAEKIIESLGFEKELAGKTDEELVKIVFKEVWVNLPLMSRESDMVEELCRRFCKNYDEVIRK